MFEFSYVSILGMRPIEPPSMYSFKDLLSFLWLPSAKSKLKLLKSVTEENWNELKDFSMPTFGGPNSQL